MITIKKILVPIDLSAVSVPAIGYASFLAKGHDAEVIPLNVLSTNSLKSHFSGGYGEGLGVPGEGPAGARQQVSIENVFESKKQFVLSFIDQKLGPDLRKTVRVRPLIRIGKLAEEIIASAKEEQCDLIVLSAHETGLRRLFGGTVTERVVRQAPCPVLSMQPSARVRTDKNERVELKLIDRWAA